MEKFLAEQGKVSSCGRHTIEMKFCERILNANLDKAENPVIVREVINFHCSKIRFQFMNNERKRLKSVK